MANEHVLIIDRNAQTRQWLVAHVMRPGNYRVTEAASLSEARAALNAAPPQAVVLSLSAHLDQILAFIANYEALVPIVTYTSSSAPEVSQAALQAGARDVLIKPFTADRLGRSIARALRVGKLARERDALREQTDRQAQEFNALYSVGKQITSLLDLEEVLSTVVTAAVYLTHAEEGALLLLDPLTGELYLRANLNLSESTARKTRVKVTDTLMGRVISSRRPVVMGTDDLMRVQTSYLVKAIASVPLGVGERVIGVLSVDNKVSRNFFNEHDVHVLSTLADYAAIAIENAQLYEETRRRAGELAALIEIDRHISSTLDLTQVLERIASHAQDLLKSDDSEVYLVDDDGITLRAIVALGAFAKEVQSLSLRVGQGIVGTVAASGVAEMINDCEHDPRSVTIPGTPDESESMLCAPLVIKQRTLGVMTVVRTGGHAPFLRRDLDFLQGLAGQAAIAIENARLYASERDRAAELLRTLDQQRELDRLKNEFVQNISHELRTPLAIVRGYAELLDSGELGELPASQRESVTVMARRSRMLSKMLDDLLSILSAETRRMAFSRIDLVQIVDAMVVDFQALAGPADTLLSATIDPDTPPVLGDAVQLRRVVDNLLGNAMKFTPPGGRVTVTLQPVDEHAVLEVRDTGIGIPPDQVARIFERFYQVDGSTTRRYGGVGLGLALVKEIVVAHGGSVSVDSVVGQGSTFRVILPAAPAA